ncbi:NlpC/P60 family protein [Albidovulum sp.]
MHWAEKLIGRPWAAGGQGPDAFDCWGLARWCWRARFGIEVPEIAVDAADLRGVLAAFRRHPERRRWRAVEAPAEGDAVLMRQSRHPVHVGLWLAVDGGGVLHVVRGAGVVFQRPPELLAHGWRIAGVYRFGGEA